MKSLITQPAQENVKKKNLVSQQQAMAPGSCPAFPTVWKEQPLLKPCHRKVKDCVGTAIPGDGAGHIASKGTIQVKGILL